MNRFETLSDAFQEYGLYGLITQVNKAYPLDDNPRATAYNLLKSGRDLAKKNADKRLAQLPNIAFDLSRHDSVYRMAGLLYIELNDTESATAVLGYLYHYYQGKDQTPHEQYDLIYAFVLPMFVNEQALNEHLDSLQEQYEQQQQMANLQEYTETLPVSDATEQKTYFKRVYRRYGVDTVMAAIANDARFNEREKAIIYLRASRAIGGIAEEGSSIESKFAAKALATDDSESVIKNAYQAYLRAGDINAVKELKQRYPQLLETQQQFFD